MHERGRQRGQRRPSGPATKPIRTGGFAELFPPLSRGRLLLRGAIVSLRVRIFCCCGSRTHYVGGLPCVIFVSFTSTCPVCVLAVKRVFVAEITTLRVKLQGQRHVRTRPTLHIIFINTFLLSGFPVARTDRIK